MRRTCDLAGRRARGQDILTVFTVIGVERLFEEHGVGYLYILRRCGIIRTAELLAELESIARADLNALCTGNALGFVYGCNIV